MQSWNSVSIEPVNETTGDRAENQVLDLGKSVELTSPAWQECEKKRRCRMFVQPRKDPFNRIQTTRLTFINSVTR